MSSPVVQPDVDASVLDGAAARLAANIAGLGAPVPAIPAVAAPQPAVQPPGSPPAEPQPAMPTPGNVITLDPSSLSPAAAKMLQIAGGDPVKALELGLDYNNRLGAKGQAAAAPPTPEGQQKPPEAAPPPAEPGTPQEAAPPSPATPEPPAEPQVDPATLAPPDVVKQQLEATLDNDPNVQPLVAAWTANDARLKEMGNPGQGPELLGATGKFAELRDKITQNTLRLGIPEVTNDPLLQAEIKDEIRNLRSELLTARQEALIIEAEQEKLYRQYSSVAEDRRTRIASQLGQKVAAQRYAESISQAWPSAVDRAVQAAGIPPELRADFAERAHDAFLVAMQRAQVIEAHHLDTFLGGVAKKMAAGMDLAHRARSGEFGRLAHQRTAAFAAPPTAPGVASTTQAPGVAPAQVPSQVPDLDAVEQRANQRMAQLVRTV